jgi:aspartate carbamoyltransferase
MNSNIPFFGRSIGIVQDLSVDEQLYLYDKARDLKRKILAGENVEEYRINDQDTGVYLIFMEDSTRTKESFRNAAHFHKTKVMDFNTAASSFNKNESIADTIKMLTGYSRSSIFIIRSKLEGVCRWLETAITPYAQKIGSSSVSFINAGDGKHEHPTQEFLDEFSFLEQLSWDTSEISLALVGDLFHGRTAHSKADGLKIFKKVNIDLIAPKELAMPSHYEKRMLDNGFNVRKFSSIEEYLEQKSIADIWYFTRLQLERMGEKVLEKAVDLRKSVTFRKEFLTRISPSVRFYHPLPRDRQNPVIPSFLDATPHNRWDEQSINGYYTRIVALAMVRGIIGEDFKGQPLVRKTDYEEYVINSVIDDSKKPQFKVGIKPVENGIVIDHIGTGLSLPEIWNLVDKVRRLLNLNVRSSHGVYHSNTENKLKGLISLPDILDFERHHIKMLGAVAPGCTINFITDCRVIKKYRLQMPPRIYGFDQISCKNENCVSFPDHKENATVQFFRKNDGFSCAYCEKSHQFDSIWDV